MNITLYEIYYNYSHQEYFNSAKSLGNFQNLAILQCKDLKFSIFVQMYFHPSPSFSKYVYMKYTDTLLLRCYGKFWGSQLK